MRTEAIFIVLGLFGASLGTFFACYRAVRRLWVDCLDARDRAQAALAKLEGLPAELLELDDRVSTVMKLLKRLNSRAGMAELRARRAGNGADECPDWRTDRDGWIEWQSRRIVNEKPGKK